MSVRETNDQSVRGQDASIPVRPPGAVAGGTFEEKCQRCTDCVSVCPVQALAMDMRGYPILINPRVCAKCGLCADVCSHRAIEFTERIRAGFALVLAIEAARHRY